MPAFRDPDLDAALTSVNSAVSSLEKADRIGRHVGHSIDRTTRHTSMLGDLRFYMDRGKHWDGNTPVVAAAPVVGAEAARDTAREISTTLVEPNGTARNDTVAGLRKEMHTATAHIEAARASMAQVAERDPDLQIGDRNAADWADSLKAVHGLVGGRISQFGKVAEELIGNRDLAEELTDPKTWAAPDAGVKIDRLDKTQASLATEMPIKMDGIAGCRGTLESFSKAASAMAQAESGNEGNEATRQAARAWAIARPLTNAKATAPEETPVARRGGAGQDGQDTSTYIG